MFTFLRGLLVACVVGLTSAKNIVELAEGVPELSNLVSLVSIAGLVDTLEGPGPFTVFAPTNEAFERLGNETLDKAELTKILTYHVASGSVHSKDLYSREQVPTVEGDNVTVFIDSRGDIFINNARVETADVDASNGVVHIIDNVLIPPAAPPTKNIVELAEEVPELSLLVKLVSAAGLVDTLEGAGPFTVFAPTNEAFERLGTETLEKLLKPENKAELTKILTYHVASGSVHSKDLHNHEQIPTVEGSDVTAYLFRDRVYINQAEVVKADNDASNGVVHIVEGVLMPKSE